ASGTVVASKMATSRIKQDPERRWVKGSLIGGSVAVTGVVLILLTRGGGKQTNTPKVPPKEGTRSPTPRPQNSGAEGPVLGGNPSPSERTSGPEFDNWVARVADLPAEEQVAAAALKLQQLNPGFEAELKPEIDEGQVTKLEFQADDLHDLSPVQVFRGLK